MQTRTRPGCARPVRWRATCSSSAGRCGRTSAAAGPAGETGTDRRAAPWIWSGSVRGLHSHNPPGGPAEPHSAAHRSPRIAGPGIDPQQLDRIDLWSHVGPAGRQPWHGTRWRVDRGDAGATPGRPRARGRNDGSRCPAWRRPLNPVGPAEGRLPWLVNRQQPRAVRGRSVRATPQRAPLGRGCRSGHRRSRLQSIDGSWLRS